MVVVELSIPNVPKECHAQNSVDKKSEKEEGKYVEESWKGCEDCRDHHLDAPCTLDHPENEQEAEGADSLEMPIGL